VVDWSAPNDNGSEVIGYKIYIRQSDGVTYSLETDNCDGSTEALVLATQCTIPVSVLKAAPFSLPWGSNVFAKVIGYNIYGDSAMSQAGS